jgi:hypothetical protein
MNVAHQRISHDNISNMSYKKISKVGRIVAQVELTNSIASVGWVEGRNEVSEAKPTIVVTDFMRVSKNSSYI